MKETGSLASKTLNPRKSLLPIFFGLIVMLGFSGIMPITVEAETPQYEYYRGPSYEETKYANDTVVWSSAPQAVFNGSQWVPWIYMYDGSKKCYRVQTGLIGGEIYDVSGVGLFYDPSMTEQRVKSEIWDLEAWDGKAWKLATLNSPISFSVYTNSSGVYVDATRTTSKPNGVLTILYCYIVGGPLKHRVIWKSSEVTDQTVRILQRWDLAESITKVRTEAGDSSISGFYDYPWFQFGNGTHPFLLFEDQSKMIENLEPTQIDFAGKKVYFTFSNWTLPQGQSLTIDPTTQTSQVTASTDDCFVYWNATSTEWVFNATYIDQRVGYWVPSESKMGGGMRWLNVNIAQGATISSAYLKIYAWNCLGGPVYSKIRGDDEDDPETFSNYTDYSNRPRTTAEVLWDDIPQWSVGIWYLSPDIKTLIQEIVNRAEWSSGNALALFWDDHDGRTTNFGADRVGNAYDCGYPTYAPKLTITYTGVAPVNDDLTLDLTGAAYKGTKTLLAGKQFYKFVLKVSDNDGVTNLLYSEIRLDPTGKNVILRATRGAGDAWYFSEQSDPSNYVILNGTGSSHSTAGNQKTFNFLVRINWVWDDVAETIGVRAYSKDADDLTDQDDYSNVFGVENDLSSTSLQVSDYRANPSQSLTFSGYWYYQGTSIPPPDGDYQVKVKLAGIQKGSTDTSLVNGLFSINANGESTVDSYPYTVEATYMTGAGSFPAVIVDKIIMTIAANSTSPTVGETVQFTVSGKYQYDNLEITTLSFQITRNGSNYATSTPFTDMQTGEVKYSYTTSSASETTYGLNIFSTNTVTVQWGGLFIEAWQIITDNTRADIESNVYLRYRLRFSGNQSAVDSGTIWVNGTSHAISSGWANFTVTSSSLGKLTYVVTAVNVSGEQDYGQIPSNPYIIWDRLEFISITADDSRINIGDTFELRYIIRYDYDDVPFSDAKGSISGFTFDGFNGWWEKILTGSSSATSTNFDETYVSITDSTYGLTAKEDVEGVDVITDGLKVSAQQIDLANKELKLRLLYAYDDSPVENGNVTFSNFYAVTNSTGWATFNLDSFPDFLWGQTAYGVEDALYDITYKFESQTIPLRKVSNILVETEIGLTLSELIFQSSQLFMTVSGSGTKYVRVSAPKPYYVKVGTLICIEGTKWTYNTSAGYTEITESYSTQTILVSWVPLSIGTEGSSGPPILPKTAEQLVVETISQAIFVLSSNYVGVIVFVFTIVGFVLACRYEQKTLAIILGIAMFYLLFDLITVFILKPQNLFPLELTFLEPILWTPPTIALDIFGPLALQQFIQVAMMGSLFAILIAAVYGVTQR